MLLALWFAYGEPWYGNRTHDTATSADYERYRRKLKAIAKAADNRLYRKVLKEVATIEKKAPEPIAAQISEIKSQIDFVKLSEQYSQEIASQLNNLLLKLEQLVNESLILERQREDEEELILIMAAI